MSPNLMPSTVSCRAWPTTPVVRRVPSPRAKSTVFAWPTATVVSSDTRSSLRRATPSGSESSSRETV